MLNVKDNGKLIVDWEESNFFITEFVPQKLYEYYGNKCIWFLDHEHIKAVQFIRDYFEKPMLVNNWFEGGRLSFRGFRTDEFYYQYTGDKTYKSVRKGKLSQHRFGRATDFNLSGITSNEVREAMMKDQKTFIEAGITTIEHERFAPSWCHVDSRITNLDELLIVKP